MVRVVGQAVWQVLCVLPSTGTKPKVNKCYDKSKQETASQHYLQLKNVLEATKLLMIWCTVTRAIEANTLSLSDIGLMYIAVVADFDIGIVWRWEISIHRYWLSVGKLLVLLCHQGLALVSVTAASRFLLQCFNQYQLTRKRLGSESSTL